MPYKLLSSSSLISFAAIVGLTGGLINSPSQSTLAASSTSVAYQITPGHDGDAPDVNIKPPLKVLWRADLNTSAPSYPLIAEGKVFEIVQDLTTNAPRLYALSAKTGQLDWGPIALSSADAFADAAYDQGKVFVISSAGIAQAFNAANGRLLWSAAQPDQAFFNSPPTALNGYMYDAGFGIAGTLYANSESDGSLGWMAPLIDGDDASPAVSRTSVYTSYFGPQTYRFNAYSGNQVWNYSGQYEGAGAYTPALHDGKLYVRDADGAGGLKGLVLDATTGAPGANFQQNYIPAFDGNLAFFLNVPTLTAQSLPGFTTVWSANNANDPFVTAPIVVAHNVYECSSGGTLSVFDESSGALLYSTPLGDTVPAPNEYFPNLPTTGLGAGEDIVVIPSTHYLYAVASGS